MLTSASTGCISIHFLPSNVSNITVKSNITYAFCVLKRPTLLAFLFCTMQAAATNTINKSPRATVTNIFRLFAIISTTIWVTFEMEPVEFIRFTCFYENQTGKHRSQQNIAHCCHMFLCNTLLSYTPLIQGAPYYCQNSLPLYCIWRWLLPLSAYSASDKYLILAAFIVSPSSGMLSCFRRRFAFLLDAYTDIETWKVIQVVIDSCLRVEPRKA